ncbi:MAG: hypothetical protein WAU61_05500 [Smithella sp.]
MKKIFLFLVLSILLNISFAFAETTLQGEQGKGKEVTTNLSVNMENIAKHLELLGYRIDKGNYLTTNGKPYFIAYSDYENNLIVEEKLPRFIDIGVVIYTEKPLSNDMKDFANRANSFFEISRMFFSISEKTKNADINFEATYIGDYSKELFGSFINIFKSDVNLIRTMNDYSKVILNK